MIRAGECRWEYMVTQGSNPAPAVVCSRRFREALVSPCRRLNPSSTGQETHSPRQYRSSSGRMAESRFERRRHRQPFARSLGCGQPARGQGGPGQFPVDALTEHVPAGETFEIAATRPDESPEILEADMVRIESPIGLDSPAKIRTLPGAQAISSRGAPKEGEHQ